MRKQISLSFPERLSCRWLIINWSIWSIFLRSFCSTSCALLSHWVCCWSRLTSQSRLLLLTFASFINLLWCERAFFLAIFKFRSSSTWTTLFKLLISWLICSSFIFCIFWSLAKSSSLISFSYHCFANWLSQSCSLLLSLASLLRLPWLSWLSLLSLCCSSCFSSLRRHSRLRTTRRLSLLCCTWSSSAILNRILPRRSHHLLGRISTSCNRWCLRYHLLLIIIYLQIWLILNLLRYQ